MHTYPAAHAIIITVKTPQYSGYLYEDFLPGGKVYCEASEPFLSMIDVMVDGPFILEKKDISLNFRGSSNQRIIDVAETRKNQEIVLLME